MTNPSNANPQRAVALAYRRHQAAPRVVAKGAGRVAAAIVERAHEHGVVVHESAQLAQLLMQVELDEEIPPGLYVAVAQLLAWIYRLENSAVDNTTP